MIENRGIDHRLVQDCRGAPCGCPDQGRHKTCPYKMSQSQDVTITRCHNHKMSQSYRWCRVVKTMINAEIAEKWEGYGSV